MQLNVIKYFFSLPYPFSHSSVPPVAEWAVPQSSRLKYRQLFNSHDKTMSGHLTGIETVNVVSFFGDNCNSMLNAVQIVKKLSSLCYYHQYFSAKIFQLLNGAWEQVLIIVGILFFFLSWIFCKNKLALGNKDIVGFVKTSAAISNVWCICW